ncbi:MAG TPA: N-acetylneuraminate synthase family protein [Terriglobales bacterium]|nr:N-acetylneuraminate synthase family protein [Terriglobales bacterium]
MLAAVLAAAPETLARDAAAAARAGAGALVVALAPSGGPARLPFELSDFGAGAAAPAAVSAATLAALAAETRAIGAGLVPSVSALAALDAVTAGPCAALYVDAAGLLDLALVAAAAGGVAPLWLDTAMATLDEVGDAVATAVKAGARPTLLHGVVTTPPRADEMNLRALGTLAARFGLPVGLALRAPSAPLATAAVALGASVVAVPFGAGGFDADGLAALAAELALVERALGDGAKRVQPSEWAERDRRHPSLVARVDIARGQALTADAVDVAPPGIGLKPRAVAGIVGRRATIDIPAGTLITLGMLE